MNPREELVRSIFDRIAYRYDRLNRIISAHLDTFWRKKAIAALELGGAPRVVLDLGTGTGDLALEAARAIGEKGKVLGLDFSLPMLRLAQEKRDKREKRPRVTEGARVFYVLASALAPPFKDNTFDSVMTAFVLRNVVDLERFFIEAHRVLKPGGKVASLDMFAPSKPFSLLYGVYFYRVMPWIGARLAGDRRAYQYLADTVRHFDSPEGIAELMGRMGFEKIEIRRFLLGAVCLHIAVKKR